MHIVWHTSVWHMHSLLRLPARSRATPWISQPTSYIIILLAVRILLVQTSQQYSLRLQLHLRLRQVLRSRLPGVLKLAFPKQVLPNARMAAGTRRRRAAASSRHRPRCVCARRRNVGSLCTSFGTLVFGIFIALAVTFTTHIIHHNRTCC